MKYSDKLLHSIKNTGSLLCVGLDPNPEQIPTQLQNSCSGTIELVEKFCLHVIDATSESCCAYKPNLAFFEALGGDGLSLFERILHAIPDGKIVIADAKRGDIGSTAIQYKKAYFDLFDVDAITLNPLMGFDTLDPFMSYPGKAVYTLVLTSNPGSNDLLKRRFEGRGSLAEFIADQLNRKSATVDTHLGMVTGATDPSSLQNVLSVYPEASLLIPGIGSQGGTIRDLLPALKGHKGIPIITSSRSILYGEVDDRNWKSAIADRAKQMKRELEIVTTSYV
ncbi:MAG: orotidine-5'-phosphate decarboxylase [Balneolaceae bacterium]